MLDGLRWRLRSLFARRSMDAELDAELQFHLEQEAAKLRRSGVPESEALRRARLALGGVTQTSEACREQRTANWLADALQDLSYSARVLRNRPAFAATAIATIALGIGAATAVFTVTNAVLLRPLPYPHADRLVFANDFLSNARFYELRERTAAVFDEMAAFVVFRTVVPREDGAAERISKAQVMTNLLPMLGARIVVGRGFVPADGAQKSATQGPMVPLPPGEAAILSYEYWQRRYRGDRAVVGKEMLTTGARGPRIIGVLAPGFRLRLPAGVTQEATPDVWIPNDRGYDAEHRDELMLRVLARVRPGVSIESAQAVLPSERLQTAFAAEVRPALTALSAAALFLLLIAGSNVASLLLARESQRERELAMRAALGAGRGRLIRQMLAEACLLAAAGTAVGTGLAWCGVRFLLAVAPESLTRLDAPSLDWRVCAFVAAAAIFQTTVFGSLTAWRGTRAKPMQIARAGGARLMGRTVVIAEIALSFVLVTACGLMLRSFAALCSVAPGYDPDHVLTFLTAGDARSVPPKRRLAFLRELQERLGAIPGVERASCSNFFPLKGGFFGSMQWGGDASRLRMADVQVVMPGYFEALGTRLRAGRTFSGQDNAPGRKVAVIDEQLAAEAFPGQSAVGQRLFLPEADEAWVEVVGVVEHQRLTSLQEPGRAQFYLTDGFWGMGISRHWALRVRGDPVRYVAAVREQVRAFAPGQLAVTEAQPMAGLLRQARAGTRFELLLIGVFALIAAVVAAVGLYGVVATVVLQRTRELGVRMALGEQPARVFRTVAGEGLVLGMTGAAIGAVLAWWSMRGMAGLLVDVTPADPWAFAAAAVLFVLIAVFASALPARSASHLDPAAVLRQD